MTRVARRWVLAHPKPNRNPSLSPPADFAVEIGLLLRRGVSVFRVVEDRGEALVVEHVESLARKRLDIRDLYTGLVGGDLKIVNAEAEVRALRGDVFAEDDETNLIALPPSHDSPAAARVSGEILSLIDQMHAYGYESLRPSPLLEIDLHRARTKLGLEGGPYGAWTVYRYDLARKRGQGAPEATVPRFSDRGGRGRSRLASIADEAIDDVIESLKENPKALIVIPDIRDDIQARLWARLKDQAKVGALMMSESTVSRRIHAAFPQSEIDRRNLGEREAKRRYRRTVGREPASFTLQDVEYDDKDTRTYLLSRQSGLSIGRCILTVGVDRYSEMPTGWETSEMARSTWSAKSCLLNGILPKDAKHPDFALATHHLACMGKPLRATFDNALYNHSNDMRASCADVPTICAYARPKVPTDKDSVERFNGTLERDFLRHQLGYAAKRREGAHAKGAAEAVMYKDEFIQRFVRWVCDQYQLKPGPSGMSPRQRWAEGCRVIKPRMPIDFEQLTLLAFLRYHRPLRLRTEGLVFMGLPYQVDHLAELRDLLGSSAPPDPRQVGSRAGRRFRGTSGCLTAETARAGAELRGHGRDLAPDRELVGGRQAPLPEDGDHRKPLRTIASHGSAAAETPRGTGNADAGADGHREGAPGDGL